MTNSKSKFQILMETLLEASTSKEWDVARKEWKVIEIYFVDIDSTSGESFYETCSCTHYPIKEVITIKNILNQKELIIGNHCITKIIEDKEENKRYKAIFNALKNKKITKELIEQAYYHDNFITQWEFGFMLNVFRKRSLSEKQDDYLMRIKDKIIRLYESKYNTKKNELSRVPA